MIEPIFMQIVDWTIRSTILAGLVGGLLWIFRMKDVQVRLAAWTVVLAASLLMPVARPFLPALPIPVLAKSQSVEFTSTQLPIYAWTFRDGVSVKKIAPAPQWMTAAVGVWLLGVLVMFTKLITGMILSARLVRRAVPVRDEILESSSVHVPVTIGLSHPRILLPADWRKWPSSKLESVLAHERAHITRRDPLRLFAASVYRAVLWFHPLTWWLRAELVDLAEAASDDAALTASNHPIQYAEMLVSFLQRAPQRVQWEGVSMASRQSRSQRIARILDSDRKLSRSLTFRGILGVVAIALPLAYVSICSQVVEAQSPQQETLNRPYDKWLDEDVAYIIMPREREAFNGLRTVEERQKFVEQFWERRDPTPGTSVNEAKEAHYRRIAYANERFRSNVAGWRTSRGHLYIIFGPPDEIEAHPSGSAGRHQGHPFEVWRYRYIEGMGENRTFEFVDSRNDGEYWLTPNNFLRAIPPERP